jgi:hypothetical protein
VCNLVVWDPCECTECEVAFCDRCFKENINQTKICPKCTVQRSFKKLNKNLKNQLNEYSFKCQSSDCQSKIAYPEMLIHLRECLKPKFKCLIKCESLEIFSCKDKYTSHLRTECSKSRFLCEYCKKSVFSSEKLSHNCKIRLL